MEQVSVIWYHLVWCQMVSSQCCNTGKFKSLSKHTAPDVGVLPPPISIPDFEDPYRWRQYVLISIILFFGVLTLVITRKKA